MYPKAKSILFTKTLLKGKYCFKINSEENIGENSWKCVTFLANVKQMSCSRNHLNSYYHLYIYISCHLKFLHFILILLTFLISLLGIYTIENTVL